MPSDPSVAKRSTDPASIRLRTDGVRVIVSAIVGLALLCTATAAARQSGGTPVALVTAETQNMLLAVELPSGKVLRKVSVPADPQNVAVAQYKVIVVSPGAGAVTLLDQRTLKTIKVLRGFGSPHLAAISPFQKWAYVTDDSRGELDVIALGTPRVVARLFVGAGAHHLTVSPRGHRAWIGLGENARAIAIVNLDRPDRPRLIRRFSPGFLAHDLAFAPDTRRVWVTSGAGDLVYALDSRTGKKVFAVRVGTAPQHVVFNGSYAFATSGYDGRIVKINISTGHIVATARTPRGSFNVSSQGGLVVTSSLLNGQVTELGWDLGRLMSIKVAPAARGVAVTVWP